MTTTIETRLGDRLDLLAGVYLLDPMKWEQITALNPGLNLTSGLYLEPGLYIEIPALMPEKIPDLLPWNNQEEIQLFEPVEVPPDTQPDAAPNEILSGSGWLTPAQIKALLEIPDYSFPLSIAEGGHNATTAEGALANLGAVSELEFDATVINISAAIALKLNASARSAANGVAPLGADSIVPASFLPTPPTLASLNGVSTATYTAGLALKLDASLRNATNGVAGLDVNSLLSIGQFPLNNFFAFTGGASFRGVPTPAIPAITTTLIQQSVDANGQPRIWIVNASATTGNKLKSITVTSGGTILFGHHADDGTAGITVQLTPSGNLLTEGTVRPGSGAVSFTGASFVPGATYFRTEFAISGTNTGALTHSNGVDWVGMMTRYLSHTSITPDNYEPGMRSADLSSIDGTLRGWHIQTNIRPDNTAFGFQIAFCDTSNLIRYRRKALGTWQAWASVTVT